MEPTSHLEIQMHAVRLMRSGNYRKATDLVRDVIRDFPEVPEGERAIAELAERIAKN